MGFTDILDKGRGMFFKGLKAFKDDLPEILMFEGAGLVAAGAIILIHDAEDISKVNIDRQETKQEIKDVDADPEGWSQMGETKKEYKKRKRYEHFKGYIKAAGPGLLVMGVGEFMQFKAEADMIKRLETTTLQLVSLATIFANYRQRNIEENGADKDYEYLTGQKIVKEDIIDERTGEIKTVKKVQIDPDHPPVFGFIFDEHNENFTKSPTENGHFIAERLNTINRKLGRHTYMFAKEMYDIFDEKPDELSLNGGALYDWNEGEDKDGKPIITTGHTVRIRPEGIQGLIDGITPYATIIFEYDDGTPLHPDISTRVGYNKIANVPNPYLKTNETD